ncbi:MAG: LysM peptidoglycan-binding domain-containing protein [Saprospiraceae bacterium]|nr:LysM peptidoglycan-binding domain-containing protein [Saprospiraceae bacterium]
MMKLLPLPAFWCLLFIGQSFSQDSTEPLWLLTPKDSVFLSVEDGKKMIHHPVKNKQTLFSIARYYHLSLEDLLEYNPSLKAEPTLKVGSKIKIPVPNKAIRRYKGTGFKAAEWVPIYYIVQGGDNLYQISKRYFEMPVDSMAKRNRLKNNSIRPGQRLHVGWMGIEGIHSDWRQSKPATESSALKERFLSEKKYRKETESQGVCFWQKESKEKGDLYALHRDAAIGTIISVTNPMGGRTVYAKVISRIPDGYEKNIEVILSPEAAKKIGARDPKFFVKVKYLK